MLITFHAATMTVKRILLLINPKARSGSNDPEKIKASLENAGHNVLLPTENDFRKSIMSQKNNIDIVVVGGGDGSINYVLPALVETQLPLVVYPLGTANLLARSFGIKADVDELLEIVSNGDAAPIDLGMVNGIYFINVCGLGVSTEVNRSVSPELKKKTGALSFWLTGLKLIKRFEPFKIRITVDDQQPINSHTWQITICNGRKYAAWMTIQPDASYDDGKLRLLSTEISKWWEGLKLLPCYMKGNYKEDLDVNFKAGRKIKVETRKPLSIDVDGDVQTSTPALFEVKTKAMKIILPKLKSTDPSSLPLSKL